MSRLWTTLPEKLFTELPVLIAVQTRWIEPLVKAFGAAGGSPVIVNKGEEGVPILRFGQPAFFILSEDFEEDHSQQSPLLDHLQKMPTSQRREMFVVWISPKVNSGDSFSAFSYSVNLVLAPDEISDIVHRIKNSWIRWKELYQGFVQTRRVQVIGH